MRNQNFRRAILICAVLGVAGLLGAAPQARIGGTVTDADGELIVGAIITLTTDEAPRYKKVVETNSKGKFKALLLDATMTYVMTVEATGYDPHSESVKVAVGTTDNDFPITLTSQAQALAASQAQLLERPGYKELKEGRDLLEAGDTAGAKVKLEAAVVALPDLLPAWTSLLQIAYDSGDNEKALEIAETCLELDDEALRCLAIASNAAKTLGKNEEADSYRTLYEELNPEDPTSLYNQAVVQINKFDDDAAKPLLEQCLEADGDYANCLFQYGMLLLRTGDMAGAKKHLERYIEVDPEGADVGVAAETVKYL